VLDSAGPTWLEFCTKVNRFIDEEKK